MYASQDIGLVDPDGRTQIIGHRIADRPAGRFCKGRRLDCRVDYLQFCHTAKILNSAKSIRPPSITPRTSATPDHADGIFMEQIGALTKVYNIDKVLSMNRRTVESANLQYSASPFGRLWPPFARNSGEPGNGFPPPVAILEGLPAPAVAAGAVPLFPEFSHCPTRGLQD